MLFMQTAIVTAFNLALMWWFLDAGLQLSSFFPPSLSGAQVNFHSIGGRPGLWFARPRSPASRSSRVKSRLLENATTSYIHYINTPTREASTPAESPWLTPFEDTPLGKASSAFSSSEMCFWPGNPLQLNTLCSDLDAPLFPTHITRTHSHVLPAHSPAPATTPERPLSPPLPLSLPVNSTKYRAPAACSPSRSTANSSFGLGSPPPQLDDDALSSVPSDMYLLLSDLFLFYVAYQAFKRLVRTVSRQLNQLLAEFLAFRAPGILESMSFSSTGSIAALASSNVNTNTNHVTVERESNSAFPVNDIPIHAPLARYWFDPPTLVRLDAAPVAEGSPIIAARVTGQDGRDPLVQGNLTSSDGTIGGLNTDGEQSGNAVVDLDGRESRHVLDGPVQRRIQESLEIGADSEMTPKDDAVTEIGFSIPPTNSQESVTQSQENRQHLNCSLCIMDTTFILQGKTGTCAHGYQSLDHDDERVADRGQGHQAQDNDADQSVSTVDRPRVQEMGIIQSVNLPEREFEGMVQFERQEQSRSEEELEFIDLTQDEPYDYPYTSSSSRSQAPAVPNLSNHGYHAPQRIDLRWAPGGWGCQTYPPQAGTGSTWRYYPTVASPQWASIPIAVPVPAPPPQRPWNVLDKAHEFNFVGPPTNAFSAPGPNHGTATGTRLGLGDKHAYDSSLGGEFTYDYGYDYNQYEYRSDQTWIADDAGGPSGTRQGGRESGAYGGFEDEFGHWQGGRGRRECATGRRMGADRPCVKCRDAVGAAGARARRDSGRRGSLRGRVLGREREGFGGGNRH